VAEWQAAIGSREFTEWVAFYELEPFGPLREDARFGVLGAGLASLQVDPKGPRPEPGQFIPKFASQDDSPARQEADGADAILAKMLAFTQASGGVVHHG